MAAKPKTETAAPQPIVIKRIVQGAAHHGGSWKVAFADFATAMMAFFMLMWLMGSTSKEQKGAISEYFKNPSAEMGTSPMPAKASGVGPGGLSTAMIKAGGSLELYSKPPEKQSPNDSRKEAVKATQGKDATIIKVEQEDADKERLAALLETLKHAIDEKESLRDFRDQVLLDVTPEGLRIQIVDKERRSMFALGSATLEPYAEQILKEISAIISDAPNRISITGHTDNKPYVRPDYGNWELSADRANAARRALLSGGMTPAKIGRVVGLSSTTPLLREDADNPINRRISIVVMNRRTEEAIALESGNLLSLQDDKSKVAPPPTATATVAADPATAAAP
jgi:chemotaxis protein MotB